MITPCVHSDLVHPIESRRTSEAMDVHISAELNAFIDVIYHLDLIEGFFFKCLKIFFLDGKKIRLNV